MKAPTHFAFLFQRAKILLAVEDELTKVYLNNICFSDAGVFAFINVGGNNGVRGVVKEYCSYKTKNVFGFIDSDFGESNYSSWASEEITPGKIFCAQVHEIENYFFDWGSFASAVGAGCDKDVIEGMALDEARKQIYWLSCRRVISEIQKLHGDGFPNHPKLSNIDSREASIRHIVGSDWVKKIKLKTEEIVNPEWIERKVEAAETQYNSALADGTWTLSFSGKEIFRQLLHATTNGNLSSDDFAKKFAKAQVENRSIPADLQELASLLERYADTL